MSDLLPFDVEEFKKEPMRLRSTDGFAPDPRWPPIMYAGEVVTRWIDGDGLFTYTAHWFNRLRLAPKTRTIRIRLFKSGGGVAAMTTSDNSITLDWNSLTWVGDEFTREIPA